MEKIKRYSKQHITRIVDTILQEANITKYPIDPIKIAHFFHLKVKVGIFEDSDVSGMINGKTKQIFIASNESIVRQRFSIAHEIGHYVLHYRGEETIFDENKELHVSYRDNVSSFGFSIKEIEANFFAACLLMPKSEIIRLWNITKDIQKIANYFLVSQIALGFRLQFLGLIDE